jgi:hypothetical protein
LEDIQQFEDDNKLTINIYCMKGDTEIISSPDGDVLHRRSGMIKLLFVEEGEQVHCIYIKNINRLMHTCGQSSYKDRRNCPYCHNGICC